MKADFKFLRVLVETEDGDKAEVRIPITMVRNGFKVADLLPKQTRQAVEAQGINLSGLSLLEANEITEALIDLSIDVCDKDGNMVKIFCE